MSEAKEGVELKAEVALTRQEFAHLWSGGVLALKVAGCGVEVALDVTYQEAPPTRGTRFLIKRVDLD